MRIHFKFQFPWWKKFFSSPVSAIALGKELQQAREKKNLSIAEVASALHFSEEVVIALENGEQREANRTSLFNPGYFRLAAVAYTRLLGLDPNKIASLLPPPASLKSPYTTFVKKLSPLQQKPRKPYFMRKEQQLTYSLNDVVIFLWKFFKITAVIVILFFLWSFVRHLVRVIF